MAELKSQKKVWKSFIIGGISGALGKTCVAPVDRVKLLMQNQDASTQMHTKHVHFEGVFDTF